MSYLEKAWRNPWIRLFIILFIGSAIILSRRPDAFLHPQFWAEDGRFWYANAYNNGVLHSLFQPQDGYLQTISRLIASAALLVPLKFAPHFFNFWALLFELLPVFIVLSDRFKKVIPPVWGRLAVALLYLFISNPEINMNVTNIQWHLALIGFLLVITEPAAHRFQRWAERGLLVVQGLSGPFSIVLAPIALWRWRDKQTDYSRFNFLVVSGCALIQILLVLTDTTRAERGPRGASLDTLYDIVARIFTSTINGMNHYVWFYGKPTILLFVVAGSIGLCLYALWKGTTELRMFNLFAGLLFAASLLSPAISFTNPQWPLMTLPVAGQRYFFIPILAWLINLFWILCKSQHLALRGIAGLLLLTYLTAGTLSAWQYTPYVNKDFTLYATRFTQAKPGQKVVIPINPEGWTMELTK